MGNNVPCVVHQVFVILCLNGEVNCVLINPQREGIKSG